MYRRRLPLINKLAHQRVSMKYTEIIMVAAVLLGPIIAVQLQKYLERIREKRNRQLEVYRTLMSYRGDMASKPYIRALNMIDVEFHSSSSDTKQILGAWKAYLDHMANAPKDQDDPRYNEKIEIWHSKSPDMQSDLLYAMGKYLGYEFEKLHIKRGAYWPIAVKGESEQHMKIRNGLAAIFDGNYAIPVTLVLDKEADEMKTRFISLLTDAMEAEYGKAKRKSAQRTKKALTNKSS